MSDKIQEFIDNILFNENELVKHIIDKDLMNYTYEINSISVSVIDCSPYMPRQASVEISSGNVSLHGANFVAFDDDDRNVLNKFIDSLNDISYLFRHIKYCERYENIKKASKFNDVDLINDYCTFTQGKFLIGEIVNLSNQLDNSIEIIKTILASRQIYKSETKQDLMQQRRHQFKEKRPMIYLALIERDGHKCKECYSIQNITIDHVIPLSKGGSDELENLQLLCRSCNSKKGDKKPA